MRFAAIYICDDNGDDNDDDAGSWDSTMSVHDPRAQQSAAKISLPGKAYSLSLSDSTNRVVVATSDRHILVFDTRNLQAGPEEVRESPLKCQTRDVACFLDGSAFAVGSIEVGYAKLCEVRLGGPLDCVAMLHTYIDTITIMVQKYARSCPILTYLVLSCQLSSAMLHVM
jgi:hypothetical protein